MHPAFSVIFLTTLIGAGQGLFLALFTGQSYSAVQLVPTQDSTAFYGTGAMIAFAFLVGGLIASVFHLGRPERAWRAAAMWRTSWLSREVIILPAVMGLIFIYGIMHIFEWDTVLYTSKAGTTLQLSLVVGAIAVAATFLLFICTSMIYATIKFLQEWACALTVVNYLLLGTASGFTLAAAFASSNAPDLLGLYGNWAIIITAAAFITRGLTEIAALGVALGANPLTFSGLAGLGDVIATCASPLSRNHYVGVELAKGRGLKEITDSMDGVAEGVTTTLVAWNLAQQIE